MTRQDDIEKTGGSALRWVARGLIVACGLMIGLVVLSDPRVTGPAREALARMQAGEESVSRQDTGAALAPLTMAAPVAEVALEAADTPQEPLRPRVSVLPESRVNVIRLAD